MSLQHCVTLVHCYNKNNKNKWNTRIIHSNQMNVKKEEKKIHSSLNYNRIVTISYLKKNPSRLENVDEYYRSHHTSISLYNDNENKKNSVTVAQDA